MPTVPVVDQSVGGSAAYSAPEVAPMHNFAPQQQIAMGQATQQLGEQAVTIGNRMQDVVDDARTKAAETQFLKAATDITTNYRALQNIDAIDGYDSAAAGLAKAQAAAESGLTNNLQRQMFRQISMQQLVDFGGQLSDHHSRQVLSFGINEADARAGNYAQLAANASADAQNPDGEYARNRKLAISEKLHAAALAGLPADSAQAKAKVLQTTTQIANGTLTRMMNDQQYDEAKDYYDKALAAGEIDDNAAATLGNAITNGHVLNQGKNIAAGAVQIALGATTADPPRIQPVAIGSITSTAAPGTEGNAKDGIDIAAPVGTNVHAPASGKVTKVAHDDTPGGGVSIEITYPNGNVETFSHLSSVNYQEGKSVTQGAPIGATGKMGDGTGAGVHWAMTDKEGNPVDPRTASPAPKDPSSFDTPEEYEKAADYVNRSGESERVKANALAALTSQYEQNQKIAAQKYAEVKQQAIDFYLSHNNSINGLPADVLMQLKSQDFYDMAKPQKPKTDVSTWYHFVTNPASLTVANVQSAYVKGDLNASDFRMLTERATAQQNDPNAVKNADDVVGRVMLYAQQHGMEVHNPQGIVDMHRLGSLTNSVLQQVDVEKANNKGTIMPDRVNAIIKEQAVTQTQTELGSPRNAQYWGRGKNGAPTRIR